MPDRVQVLVVQVVTQHLAFLLKFPPMKQPAYATYSGEMRFYVESFDAVIVGLRNCTKAIYVFGEITYRDAFGHDRHTNYRYRHNGLTGVVGINSDLTGSDEGNSSN
jgi:hypothetical protein